MLIILPILVLGFILGFLFSKVWYKDNRHIARLSKISGRHKGIHFHHSMWGVMILLALPFLNIQINLELFLSGLSIGIITDHTIQEGFIFITREANDFFYKIYVTYIFLLVLYLPQEITADVQ